MANNTMRQSDADAVFAKPELQEVRLDLLYDSFFPGEPQNLPFWGKLGWARFTKMVVLTETRPDDFAALGALLSAEWIDELASLRIGPDSEKPGQLQKLTVTEVAAPAGEPFWREDVIVHGHRPAARRSLVYRVYLEDVGEGAVRRAFDAFHGFERGAG